MTLNQGWIVHFHVILLMLTIANVKGRNDEWLDVCVGEDASLSCPPGQRIILTSSVVVQNTLTCWQNSGPCFSSNIKEILLRFCSAQQSCHLNNSQLISSDSTWCGHNTVLEVSYYCEEDTRFFSLCNSDEHTPSQTGTRDDVLIGVHYNDHKSAVSSSEINKPVVECTVDLWQQVTTGFDVKIMDADFPDEIGAKLCQESLYVGQIRQLEIMQTNSSHLFCDDVKTSVRVRTGISRFQVVQRGHINWGNHRGLLIGVSGEQMKIERRVTYSNHSYSPATSTTELGPTTVDNILMDIDNVLMDIERQQEKNTQLKNSSGLITSMAVLVTIAMLFFIVILGVAVCWKRNSRVVKITEDDGSISQRSAYVIGSLMDLRKYRPLGDGDVEENFSPTTNTTICSDESSEVENFRHDLDLVSEIHSGGFQPVLEAISEENLEDLDEVMTMGHIELDGSTIALYGSPDSDYTRNWKTPSRMQSPLTASRFYEPNDTDDKRTVAIEMKQMDHDGHYTEQPIHCETRLDEASSVDVNKSSFLQRLGLLKKHGTFTDITSVFANNNKGKSNSNFDGLNVKKDNIDIQGEKSNATDGNSVYVTVCFDAEKQQCTFIKNEEIMPNNNNDDTKADDTAITQTHLTIPKLDEGLHKDLCKDAATQNTAIRNCISLMNEDDEKDTCPQDVNNTISTCSVVLQQSKDLGVDADCLKDVNDKGDNTGHGETHPESIPQNQQGCSPGNRSTLSSFIAKTNTSCPSINYSRRQDQRSPIETFDSRRESLEIQTYGQPLAASSQEDLSFSMTSGEDEDNVSVFPFSSSLLDGLDDADDIVDGQDSVMGSPSGEASDISESRKEDLDKTEDDMDHSCDRGTVGGSGDIESLENSKTSDDVTREARSSSLFTNSYQKTPETAEEKSKSAFDDDVLGGSKDESKAQSTFRDTLNFQQINIVQKCYYNTWVEQKENDTDQFNREKSLTHEQSLDYDFDDEIELTIHNDIDLNEGEKFDLVDRVEDRSIIGYLEVDCGEISPSNNSSFINISWSQTDSATKQKLAKETCFTQ